MDDECNPDTYPVAGHVGLSPGETAYVVLTALPLGACCGFSPFTVVLFFVCVLSLVGKAQKKK